MFLTINMSPTGTRLISSSPSPTAQTILLDCALNISVPFRWSDTNGLWSDPFQKSIFLRSTPNAANFFFPVMGLLYTHWITKFGITQNSPWDMLSMTRSCQCAVRSVPGLKLCQDWIDHGTDWPCTRMLDPSLWYRVEYKKQLDHYTYDKLKHWLFRRTSLKYCMSLISMIADAGFPALKMSHTGKFPDPWQPKHPNPGRVKRAMTEQDI